MATSARRGGSRALHTPPVLGGPDEGVLAHRATTGGAGHVGRNRHLGVPITEVGRSLAGVSEIAVMVVVFPLLRGGFRLPLVYDLSAGG